MQTLSNSLANPPRTPRWPPVGSGLGNQTDIRHWKNQAARGFSWNADGVAAGTIRVARAQVLR